MPRLPRTAHPSRTPASAVNLTFHPLTPDRWSDLVKLFGPRGACGGCWCMTWRLTPSVFEQQKGEGNKRAFRKIVSSGAQPGVLAYADGQPVGWCAVSPRSQFSFLERSRILAPLDDLPVWSITCLFVAKEWRRCGMSSSLIRAASDHAGSLGARIVEAYPLEIRKETPAAFAWTGLASAFRKAGFKVTARRSPSRPIMRFVLEDRDE